MSSDEPPLWKEPPLNLFSVRRVVQLLTLVLWAALFHRAYVIGNGLLQRFPVPDLFLRTDPLAGILSSAAARRFGQELLFWTPMALLPFLLGRAFCGWACPLGTLLDAGDHAAKTAGNILGGRPHALLLNRIATFRKYMQAKYYVLIALVVAAGLSAPLFGYLDPLCILNKAFAFTVLPWLGRMEFDVTGRAPLFGYAGTSLHFFNFPLFAGLTLLSIIFMNRFFRRAWCRTLCPLGAALGAAGRFSLFTLSFSTGKCRSCLKCAEVCKTGAIDFPEKNAPVSDYHKSECILCYSCVNACPHQCLGFHFSSGARRYSTPAVDMTRRGLVQSALAGAVLAPLVKLGPPDRDRRAWAAIRPPFSHASEAVFLDSCIRCGLCMRVCKTNTLQPAYLETGLEGLMTPVLKPAIGGCDPECNACGMVCPTNAIRSFSAPDKLSLKMGTAKLELDRCIGYTENKDCNECAKICPTQCIKVRRINGVLKPVSVVAAECNGCAMCEKRCREIIANGTACIATGRGRGLVTDIAVIRKNLELKKQAGPSFLPEA